MAEEQKEIAPVKTISGEVLLPGSKSLSNRILLLAALSEGTTVVENILVTPPLHHHSSPFRCLPTMPFTLHGQ